jgi:hypothetical protein
VLLLCRLKSSDAGAQEHADLIQVLLFEVEPGILERPPSGIDAEVGEAICPPHFLTIREGGCWIEVADFRRDLAIVAADVEPGHAINAALSGKDVAPYGVRINAQRRNATQAGDDHTAVRPIAAHIGWRMPLKPERRRKQNR